MSTIFDFNKNITFVDFDVKKWESSLLVLWMNTKAVHDWDTLYFSYINGFCIINHYNCHLQEKRKITEFQPELVKNFDEDQIRSFIINEMESVWAEYLI